MGVIRKLTSASTLGLVDFRSDKERMARSSRQTAKQAGEQTKLLQQQLEMQQQAVLQANSHAAKSQAAPVAGPPAGWMLDPQGSGRQRWWDGTTWTEHFQG